MKILLINSVCGIKSTGRICTDLATSLDELGHEVKILYGREYVPEQYKKYANRISNSISVYIDVIKSRIYDNAGFNSSLNTKKALHWIKQYDPDIVHIHNVHGYYVNIELLFNYFRANNTKVIWTLHDCWSFTGHCAWFTRAKCDKWKYGCKSCPELKSYPESLFFDRSSENYNKKKKLFADLQNLVIVTPSDWLGNLASQSIHKNHRVLTIHNGIDLDVFKENKTDLRERYNLNCKKIVLGVAGAWGPRKGAKDFIELSKRLGKDYQIVMIGLSEDQIKSFPDNIIKIAPTKNVTDLVDWYSVADVFVNTTYEDNYPTVNIEAQACGTPVVTYNTGGSGESVPNENVIEQGDIESLLNAIERNCSDKEPAIVSRESLGKNLFTKKYLDLYLHLLNRGFDR